MFAFPYQYKGAYSPELGFIFGNSIFRFDNTSDPFSVGTLSQTAGSCANIGKTIYIFGTAQSISSYDGSTQSSNAAVLAYGTGSDHSASSLNSQIYIFGGTLGGGTDYVGIQLWDGTYRNLVGTLAAPSYGHTSEVLGGNIYVFGGYHNSTVSNLIQKWTGSTISINSATIQARYQHCSSVVGSSAYVFGGSYSGGISSSIQKFDGTNSSVSSTTLGTSSQNDTASVMSGVAYIFATGAYVGAGKNYIQQWDGTTLSSLSFKCAYGQNYCSSSIAK